MVAILTDDDAYTIVELLSDPAFEVGDEVYWENGYGLGSETYTNKTRGSSVEVYVQNHAVGQSLLRQQLLL
jgi:hypothetical protein